MRHRRAVEKLRILAETCERVKLFWFDTEPFLRAVYAFGEVLDGADPLDAVQVAVAINLPPEEVPWQSTPKGADWLADELRLSKGGFMYFWRSYLDPAWNHYIRGPVRIWSIDGGPDEQALAALAAGDSGSLQPARPDPVDERLQLRDDLDAALAHLREVRDKYWDHDWRREHRGYGRYPENELVGGGRGISGPRRIPGRAVMLGLRGAGQAPAGWCGARPLAVPVAKPDRRADVRGPCRCARCRRRCGTAGLGRRAAPGAEPASPPGTGQQLGGLAADACGSRLPVTAALFSSVWTLLP